MHHPINEIENQNMQNVTEQISRQLVLWFVYPKKWLEFKIWNVFRYFILNVAANWLWMKTNCVVVKKKRKVGTFFYFNKTLKNKKKIWRSYIKLHHIHLSSTKVTDQIKKKSQMDHFRSKIKIKYRWVIKIFDANFPRGCS